MGKLDDEEDLFMLRVHASRIRDREEWEQDTGVFPVVPPYMIQKDEKKGYISSAADGVSKVVRAARNWPAVVALGILAATIAFVVYTLYGRK